MATKCSLTFLETVESSLNRWNLLVAFSWLKSLHLFCPLNNTKRKCNTEAVIFTKFWFESNFNSNLRACKARTHLHPFPFQLCFYNQIIFDNFLKNLPGASSNPAYTSVSCSLAGTFICCIFPSLPLFYWSYSKLSHCCCLQICEEKLFDEC